MEKKIANVSLPVLNVLKRIFPEIDNKELVYTNVIIPKEQAWGTYKIRYNIAVREQSLDANSLKMYKSALDQLESFKGDNVSIHLFNYKKNNHGLVVFSDADDKNIIGHYTLIDKE